MIPLSKPHLTEADIQEVVKSIKTNWITQGPAVEKLELAFAKYTGANYACAVSNCTVALQVALLTCDVKPGNLVLTVSHSFIASANAIRACNAEPLFIDIDRLTLNISPTSLENFIKHNCNIKDNNLYYKDVQRLAVGESPLKWVKESEEFGKIAAILPVHQIGLPCDMKAIEQIATHYQLPIIEDAACAIGSKIFSTDTKQWQNIGKPFGDICCFSFHPRKVITCGDGGMLTTNNEDFYKKFKLLRHHGMSTSDLSRHSNTNITSEEYLCTAFNFRMTDIQASLLSNQLARIEEEVVKRIEIAIKYRELLQDIPGISLLSPQQHLYWNYQSFPIFLDEDFFESNSDIIKFMKSNEIFCKTGIMNAHKEPPYLPQKWQLPESEKSKRLTLLLPLFYDLKDSEIFFVCEKLKEYINQLKSKKKFQ